MEPLGGTSRNLPVPPFSAKVSGSLEKEMKTELDRVAKQFGGGAGVDMTKFPELKFSEPKVDPIDSVNK